MFEPRRQAVGANGGDEFEAGVGEGVEVHVVEVELLHGEVAVFDEVVFDHVEVGDVPGFEGGAGAGYCVVA